MDAVAPIARARLAAPRALLGRRSDAALAARFAEGNDAAFALLYERHRATVLAVCMGVLGSRHDAEDAAQESFAALAVALRSRAPDNIGAWLTRVARNAAIDAFRRRKSNLRADDEIPDRSTAPDGVNDEFASVLAGIRELPEAQRTALLMRELAGHSYHEIAELLEINEESVRGLISRARIGLRTHREASKLSCAAVRDALAGEPDGRRREKTVRRHLRGCASCRAYRQGLRRDAKALHGLVPLPAGGLAGGGAVFGGLAAKGALVGGALTQVTAVCAVSVCAVGGIVLLDPPALLHHHSARAGLLAPPRSVRSGHAAGLHHRGAAGRVYPGRAAGAGHAGGARLSSTSGGGWGYHRSGPTSLGAALRLTSAHQPVTSLSGTPSASGSGSSGTPGSDSGSGSGGPGPGGSGGSGRSFGSGSGSGDPGPSQGSSDGQRDGGASGSNSGGPSAGSQAGSDPGAAATATTSDDGTSASLNGIEHGRRRPPDGSGGGSAQGSGGGSVQGSSGSGSGSGEGSGSGIDSAG